MRVEGSGFRDQGSGFRVQGSGLSGQGSGIRVQGSGSRVQGSGETYQHSDPSSPRAYRCVHPPIRASRWVTRQLVETQFTFHVREKYLHRKSGCKRLVGFRYQGGGCRI